ncbi:hypothetical protein niasHT_039766 [Heterodera trifolii]|uniref:Bardet-Biedl syndrome 7 protein n=1 Tax=Heterodera trifolii TaxID=157864 RepID=A0ABD2IMI9_9BILA
MEVVLSRVDYAHVGTTSKGCLCVIQNQSPVGRAEDQPITFAEDGGEKAEKLGRRGRRGSRKGMAIAAEDKVVIGGQNGVLLCMERRNNDTNILFKTPPGPPISRIYLGGALGSVQDKAFVACGTEVRGYSRKGKQFLTFESNLTEDIRSLFVYGVDMFIGGTNSLYNFHDCVEKSHFSCADPITDCVCLPVTEGGWVGRGLTPVLACADKTIKVLDGSRLVYDVPVCDVPTVLHLFCNDGGYNKQKVLFGCRNGVIGLVDLGVDYSNVSQQMETKSFAAVTSIHCYPLLDQKGSRPDVVVGKEDGLIELYAVDENDTLAFRQLVQCEESITGLCCGRVGSPNFAEIVVSTYSGWVFSLTTEPVFSMSGSSATTNRQNETGGGENDSQSAAMAPQMEVKVQQMRMELDQLESRVRTERERFHGEISAAAQQQQTGGAVQQSLLPVAELAPAAFTVNDRFALRKELACYTLFVELSVPIDYVLMQSDVKVDLLDVERNSAVTSKTEPELGSGNALLAVYRCQADITRMEMRIRSIEGQFGTLRLYIVPRLNPLTCKMRSYPIKPLALHERVHQFDESRPMNVLSLVGPFSIHEAHSWLVLCVAEVPERCPQAETVTFNFRSTFNGGTMLQASYSKGRAIYRSDNLSTIVILRDVITRIVTVNQLKVHISCDMNSESIGNTLALIWPRLEHQIMLVKRLQLANGLKELEASFEDISYLNTELRSVLESQDKLQEEVDSQAVYFDRILGIITDLYIDKYKMLGQNVKHKAKELLQMLHDSECTLETLQTFFNTKQ